MLAAYVPFEATNHAHVVLRVCVCVCVCVCSECHGVTGVTCLTELVQCYFKDGGRIHFKLASNRVMLVSRHETGLTLDLVSLPFV